MQDKETEIKKTVTEQKERGAVLDTSTGSATIPTADGVKVEQLNQAKYVLDDTPHNRAIMAKVLANNGFPREAKELLGQKYEPNLLGSAKNLITENTSIFKGLVAVAIGAFTFYLGKKAIKYLSKRMGWNLFVEVTHTPPPAEPETQSRMPLRRQPVTQMPQASA